MSGLDVEAIQLPGGGRALFTGRVHGNLSSVGGERAEHGLKAREDLREALGLRRLVRGYQVHGTVVGRVLADGHRLSLPNRLGSNEDIGEAGPDGVHQPSFEPDGVRQPGFEPDGGRQPSFEPDGVHQPSFEADGHAVAAPGVAAMVLTADCVPVVLGSEGAVAALHAGWRGLAAGVLQEGVRALREVGGQREMVAVVGPCAGACCYEVGEEVHDAFGGSHRKGKSIDLRAIAHERLLAAGVTEVRDVEACTICDERFFSYRREGTRAGRQAGIAWLS